VYDAAIAATGADVLTPLLLRMTRTEALNARFNLAHVLLNSGCAC
jgi:ABC-type cobalamin transport system permease subunit